MADSDHHLFGFRNASAELGIQPSSAPAGTFPLVAGIDGRFGDVLRRYPGHKRYPDSTDQLGCTTTADVFQPTGVFPFEIQKTTGIVDKVRGFVVYDETTGNCELWYRFSTDADGVLRKFEMAQTGGCVFRTLTDPTTEHTPQSCASGIGELPAIFNGAVFTTQIVNNFCVHADGTGGTFLYAVGLFRSAGDRHCQCIVKWDGIRWQPIPDSFFDGGAILCLASYTTGLFVGGAFTSKGTFLGGQDSSFQYFCQWDGAKWSRLGGGPDGAVRTMLVNGTDIIIGGSFSNVGDDYTIPPATASQWLAKWQTASNTWAATAITFTGGSGVFALALGGGNLYLGGDFTAIDEGGAVAGTKRVAYLTNPTALSGATQMASGVDDGVVYAISYLGGIPYVGGSFTAVGGAIANTRAISRFTGGVWQAIGNYFTAGTVYSIDLYGTAIVVTGASLTPTGGSAGGIWYSILPGVFWGDWTRPVGMPTTVDNIQCQLEWDGFRYYGGRDQGTALSLNPLAAPVDENGAPTASGPKIDVAYHDRYIFILASNGVKKVLAWDHTTTDWKIASFGPGLLYATGAPVAAMSSVNGSGGLATGDYNTFYRYFDPDRRRWSGLSSQNDDIGDTEPFYGVADLQHTDLDLWRAPDGYTQTELFSTISSTATNILAGGSIYRVARGSLNSTTRRSTVWWGAPTFVDYGNGEFHWALTNDSIPDPSRIYKIDVEDVGELNDVYAVGVYQGLTIALEDRGGFLVLRWSNSFRTEWESFPPLNGFQTGIRRESGWSCRFIAAGDYLYLIGGDQIYRIQRVGVSLSIIKVYSGLSIINRAGCLVVGNQLYIVTSQGLLVMDPRSASGGILRRLDRVFYDRWRSTLVHADTTYSISMAYDAQMECIYIHNNVLQEAVCLWTGSGKTTLLLNTGADMVVSFPDIDSDLGERAYFFTRRRWFTVPQHVAGEQAATMQGDFLTTGVGPAAELVKYNWEVYGVTEDDTNCPNYASARTMLTLAPTAPSTNADSAPFTTDGNPANKICISPMAIMVLSGAAKGKMFTVVGNSSTDLWLASNNSGIAEGDIIAMAPVTTFVMGSMVWDRRGTIRPTARKRHFGGSISVSRTSSTGTLAQTTPVTGTSLVQFGVSRQANFTDSEPRSPVSVTNSETGLTERYAPNDVAVVPAYSEVDGPLNVALDLDKEAANWSRKTSDGTLVYPWFALRTSNYDVEVLGWDVLASVEATQLAGPGTL